MSLPYMGNGAYGQIFKLTEGRCQLTTGVVTDVKAAWCHVAGDIVVTFTGGGTETLTFEEGDQFAFEDAVSVSITTGTWSFV
jgi:hypothetical protein